MLPLSQRESNTTISFRTENYNKELIGKYTYMIASFYGALEASSSPKANYQTYKIGLRCTIHQKRIDPMR